jgi:hypothetical protein
MKVASSVIDREWPLANRRDVVELGTASTSGKRGTSIRSNRKSRTDPDTRSLADVEGHPYLHGVPGLTHRRIHATTYRLWRPPTLCLSLILPAVTLAQPSVRPRARDVERRHPRVCDRAGDYAY